MKVAIGRRQQSGQGPMKTSSDYKSLLINRRTLLGYSAALGVAAGLRGPLSAWAQESPLGVNADEWTPDYISSIAGTLEVDTAAECAKVVPLDYTGITRVLAARDGRRVVRSVNETGHVADLLVMPTGR